MRKSRRNTHTHTHTHTLVSAVDATVMKKAHPRVHARLTYPCPSPCATVPRPPATTRTPLRCVCGRLCCTALLACPRSRRSRTAGGKRKKSTRKKEGADRKGVGREVRGSEQRPFPSKGGSSGAFFLDRRQRQRRAPSFLLCCLALQLWFVGVVCAARVLEIEHTGPPLFCLLLSRTPFSIASSQAKELPCTAKLRTPPFRAGRPWRLG